MKIIKQGLLLVCAVGVILLIPVFMGRRAVIPTDMPALTHEEIVANKEDFQKQEAQQEEQARARRVAKVRSVNFACEQDDDCIIVDKDPCGCLVGPKGVAAINVSRSLEFTHSLGEVVAKACPEGEPSHEKECSPKAEAVCRNKTCKIIY